MGSEPSKYELLRHALGVQRYNGGRRSKPYRNHFCAGGRDVATWETLVVEGYATRSGGLLDTFYVTDAGRAAALAGLTFKRRWGYGRPVNP